MEKTVIALGFFDGVHRGHGALLRKTAERARELGAVPAAFTFDRPPKEVVTGQPVYLINSNRDRQGLMERLYGIERVIFAPFDREMMTMPWEAYLEMLIGTYGAVHFVAGHDHRFGHKNAGNVQLLRQKCAEMGIGCDIIPPVQREGITVSSTYIRTLVEAGDMERAADFLGHRHCLSQTVQHGQRIGRTIGIPTVNLAVPEHVLAPAHGVYVTEVFLPDGRRCARRDQRGHAAHGVRQRSGVRGDVPAGLRGRPVRAGAPGRVLPPAAGRAEVRHAGGAAAGDTAEYSAGRSLF